MSDEEQTDTHPTIRYCSKCGRPTKGHTRPWGADCTYSSQELAEEEEVGEPAVHLGTPQQHPSAAFNFLPASHAQLRHTDFSLPPSLFGSISTTRPISSTIYSTPTHSHMHPGMSRQAQTLGWPPPDQHHPATTSAVLCWVQPTSFLRNIHRISSAHDLRPTFCPAPIRI